MSAIILNTDANINAKTVLCAENSDTITGVKTFDLDPNPPFVVTSGSAVVPNLDADKVDGLHGVDLATVATNRTITATWTFTTAPVFSISPFVNAGLQFPAVQASAAGANILDDYEEGTFTPILNFGGATTGITYTTQTGFYTKIGNLVHIDVRMVLSNKGSAVGAATVTNMPFSATGVPALASDATAAFTGLTGAVGCIISATTLFPTQSSATGRAQLTDTVFTNTTELRVSGTYLTAT